MTLEKSEPKFEGLLEEKIQSNQKNSEDKEKIIDKKEDVSEEATEKDIKQIKEELRERGVEEKDIRMATTLMTRIAAIDKMVFPENPAIINFYLKKSDREDFAGFIEPKEGEKERCYSIFVKELSEGMNREKKEKSIVFFEPEKFNKLKLLKCSWEELLISIAAHEVRHRIQKDYKIRMFSPRDAESVDNPLLKSLIKFMDLKFKEKEKIFKREKKPKEFIEDKLSQKEFDAEVAGEFILNKIHKRDIPQTLEEIVSLLKIEAPANSRIQT